MGEARRLGLLEAALSGRSPRTQHHHVVQELGRGIVGGNPPVGGILPSDAELALQFGVSRTVLREAMKTLAAKGLVEPRPRVGTRVLEPRRWSHFDADVLMWRFDAGIGVELVDQLNEMRLSVEPYAAGLAAERADAEDARHLLDLARSLQRATTAEAFARADLDFHLAVLAATKNPFMNAVGALIEAALLAAFRLSSPAAEEIERERVAAAHLAIAEAVERREPASASEGMRVVILVGRERVLRSAAANGG